MRDRSPHLRQENREEKTNRRTRYRKLLHRRVHASGPGLRRSLLPPGRKVLGQGLTEKNRARPAPRLHRPSNLVAAQFELLRELCGLPPRAQRLKAFDVRARARILNRRACRELAPSSPRNSKCRRSLKLSSLVGHATRARIVHIPTIMNVLGFLPDAALLRTQKAR